MKKAYPARVTKWVTSDGKEFNREEQANAHEAELADAARVEDIVEQIAHVCRACVGLRPLESDSYRTALTKFVKAAEEAGFALVPKS